MKLGVLRSAVVDPFARQLELQSRLRLRAITGSTQPVISLATSATLACPCSWSLPAQRLIVDNFLPASFPPDAVRQLRAATRSALSCDPHTIRGRIFPPLVPGAAEELGEGVAAIAFAIVEYMRVFVKREMGVHDLHEAEALLQWLHVDDLPADVDVDPQEPSYIVPHIDVANRPQYSISSVLYLATGEGRDFEGGRLVFHDPDADRVLVPREGRLVVFTSGVENPHSIERVTRGERFALSVWFSNSGSRSRP